MEPKRRYFEKSIWGKKKKKKVKRFIYVNWVHGCLDPFRFEIPSFVFHRHTGLESRLVKYSILVMYTAGIML